MSATDKYPRVAGVTNEDQWLDMCDEIDALRARAQSDEIVFNAINQLVRELTAHADAMREQLAEACPFLALADFKLRDSAAAAIEAYDDFVKEC